MSQSPRPFRIGIHGQRNAGKTCLFACLYGLRDRLHEPPVFDDESTLVYLRDIWGWLRSGRMPQATAMSRPAQVRFRLHEGGDEAREIISIDYSGALVEPSIDPATRQLSVEAREWLINCDAVLVLVDSSAPEVEQLDAVELLLSGLRESGRRDIARPLALVLTKWDTQGRPSPDPVEEAERLEQYLVQHRVFGRLHERMRDSAADPQQGFAVFPISAFGTPGPSANRPPPIEQMRPYNILTPWQWATRQTERRDAAEHRRSRRRFGIAAAVTIFATILALAGAWYYANQRTEREFIELRDYRAGNADDPQAPEREARDDRFLAAWWSRVAPRQRDVVRAWRETDHERAEAHRAEVARIERQKRHDELLTRITGEAVPMAERGEERAAYELCEMFLTEFPESPRLAEVRQTQLSVRNRWDDRVWSDVRTARPQLIEEGKLLEFAALVNEYLRLPGARNRAEAERMLQEAEWQIDRRQYQELLAQSRKGTTAANLLEVARLADEYLKSPRQRRQMAPAATRWQAWFNELREPGLTFQVRVRRISIPRDGGLDSIWGMKPAVVIGLGETELKTVRNYKGREIESDEALKPLTYRWGDRGPLRVRVENTASSSLRAEIVFPESAFLLTHLNDPVKITDTKGKTITVILECREAIPPGLPEYGVKE